MKFTVKGLITLFITSSALVLTPMRSDAQVNMKRLAEVADSCQKDVVSKSYYQQMRLDINDGGLGDGDLGLCVESRYHYSLVLSQFPWLSSAGEIMPGYPAAVVIKHLADRATLNGLLDCLVSQNASSSECGGTRRYVSAGGNISGAYVSSYEAKYLIYVCPSCVVAYNYISGSQIAILKGFIEWFIKLDKPQ